jgi:hypothetical protein
LYIHKGNVTERKSISAIVYRYTLPAISYVAADDQFNITYSAS